MKTLRALLLTEHGIREVELDNTNIDAHLASMYRLIDCQTVDGAGYPDRGHAAWVDDEGMLTATRGTLVTHVDWHGAPLFGNLLVTGFDHTTGETTAATMSRDELASHIHQVGLLLEDLDL